MTHSKHSAIACESVTAALGAACGINEATPAPCFRFDVECRDKDGALLWQESFSNLVVDVGAAFLLEQGFAAAAYTAAWFGGLVDNAAFSAFAAGDTMASHAGWTESTSYSQPTRPALTFAAAVAATRSKATNSPSVYTMTGSGTIKGLFITTNSTKGGTTGTLYSAGAFATAQPFIATNTIAVSATLTLT